MSGGGGRLYACVMFVLQMSMMLPSLSRKWSLFTLFLQTCCERRPAPCSALDKFFSPSCDCMCCPLCGTRLNQRTRDNSRVTIRGGGGDGIWLVHGSCSAPSHPNRPHEELGEVRHSLGLCRVHCPWARALYAGALVSVRAPERSQPPPPPVSPETQAPEGPSAPSVRWPDVSNHFTMVLRGRLTRSAQCGTWGPRVGGHGCAVVLGPGGRTPSPGQRRAVALRRFALACWRLFRGGLRRCGLVAGIGGGTSLPARRDPEPPRPPPPS